MKPLKFNEQMIAAIRDGRKTQTRRVINNLIGFPKITEFQKSDTPGYEWTFRDKRLLWNDFRHSEIVELCPFGKVGDTHLTGGLIIQIVSVRIEKLGDISESDCLKEGIACLSKDGGLTYKYGIPDTDGLPGNDDIGWHWAEWEVSAKAAFKKLWESIYPIGAKAWRDDLWVWVIDFEVVK